MFSWPIAIAAGLYWGQSQGYRFILENTAGIKTLGNFALAYSLGGALVNTADALFHQLYLPVYYREISEETTDSHISAWNTYAKKLVGAILPLGIYIACAGPVLGYWLVDKNYRYLSIYAMIGAVSELLRIISSSFYLGIIANKKTSVLIVPGIIGTFIALLGTFILSLIHPILGTGLSLITSNLIVCFGLYFQLKKKYDIAMPWKEIGQAVYLSLPLGFILLMAYKFGWADSMITNLIILVITGLGMLYIQWRLAKDIWFKKPNHVTVAHNV
jgi:O-antigen/teichoic acid export membrane protein